RDASHEAASFGQFLGVHANIAAQVSQDPTPLNNKEFMETHPELQDYLKSHPAAQAQLQQNPQAFLQSAQQATKPAPKSPSLPRPLQKLRTGGAQEGPLRGSPSWTSCPCASRSLLSQVSWR